MSLNRHNSTKRWAILLLSLCFIIGGNFSGSLVFANQDTEFRPTDISGLQLWLDATNIDASNNTSLGINSSIATWVDLSGNGNNALQPTPNDQPTYSSTAYLNSQPGITFSNHYLDIDSTLTPGTSARTIILVTAPFESNTRMISLNGNNSSTDDGSIFIIEPKSIRLYGNKFFTTELDLNALNIFTVRNDTNDNIADVEGFKNGTLLGTNSISDAPINLLESVTRIGGWSSVRFNGILSEVLIFDTKLTDEELQKINLYLSIKWNLQSAVDSDGDTYTDDNDAFPLDVNEWADNDLDGIGNNDDIDDDNDNVLDENDCAPLDNTNFTEVTAYVDSNNDTFANNLIGEVFCTDGTTPDGYTLKAGSYSFSTNEDTLKSFRETNFTEILNEFEKIRITELPTKGDLKLGNNTVTLNQEIEQTDVGNLAFNPYENIFGSTSFKWQEINTSIGLYSDSIQFIIDILPIDDPISIDNTTFPAIAYEHAYFSYTPMVEDPNAEKYELHLNDTDFNWELIDLNETISSSGNIELTNNGSYKLSQSLLQNIYYEIISNASENITLYKEATVLHEFTPSNNEYQILFDQSSPTSDSNYKLVCNSCDENEIYIPVSENTVFEFTVNNKPDWLALNTITGEIYGTPNSEDIGLYKNISYTVSNSNLEISSNEFYINVKNTNDPPTAYSIPNETVSTPTIYEGETILIDLIATDPDEDSLRYYISQKPVNGDASIAGNQLTYRHKGTNTTSDSLTYYAKDSGLSSDAVSINIEIIPVNDYPELSDYKYVMSIDEAIDIYIEALDEETPSNQLTIDISQPSTGTLTSSNGHNQFRYAPPNTLNESNTIFTSVISVTDDSSPALTSTANLTIYRYQKNTNGTILDIPDIELNMGHLTLTGNKVYDIDNDITLSDTVSGSALEYSIEDNDYFDINSSSGIISLISTINFLENIPTIDLNVYASGIVDNELIGIYTSFNVNVIQHYDLTNDIDNNDIPDEFEQNKSGNFMLKDNMIIDSSYEDLNLSELNINIDDGKSLTFENGNIEMNTMIIGSEDNSTVMIEENGSLLLGSLILSETKGDSSELIINQISSELIINEESSIGLEGNGTLTIEKGSLIFEKSVSLGEDLYASGSLDVSSNSVVFIQENLNMNGLGKSNVACNSGTFSVGNTLTLSGDNSEFNIDGCDVYIKDIIVDDDSTFNFPNGELRFETYTGTLISEGTLYTSDKIITDESTDNDINISQVQSIEGLNLSTLTTNVTIYGNYIQENNESGTSNLVFTIFEENNHSKLNITGTARFFGLLTVQSDSNMEFKLNQSFKFFDAGRIEGAFSSLSLPSLNNDMVWDTSQLYTDGMLSIKLASQIEFTPVSIYIYPNPLLKGTSPTIQYTLEQSTKVIFDLYNMFGHQLYSTEYESGENGGKIDLNTVSIPQGIIDQLAIGPYFIIIHNDHQTLGKGIFTIK